MKRIKLLLVLVLTFVFSINTVSAACESKELNQVRQDAYKVTVSSELMKEELEKGTYDPPDGLTAEEAENFVAYDYYFNLYISNVIDDLYITVKENNSNDATRYDSSDATDGVITIKVENVNLIHEFTIDVYASNPDCGASKLRTITKTTPMQNRFYNNEYCKLVPNYYLCREYIDFNIEYSYDEVINKIKSQIKQQEQEEEQKQQDIITKKERNNKIKIAGITVIIVAGVATIIVIVMKKRRVANEKY